ncbi:MAG: type I-U CRISPR-associated protein Cas5/Cas6, partial [Chloracidobacterium sp. CP2_5A]
MPTVKIRFPGGRYHATPWGHHVNEGLIEWPPSPWRLLRALLACGFSSQGWTDVPPVARRLIDKLAAVLPKYHLPDASAAHSRHYMPIIEGKVQKTTLVFDTWANVGADALLIHWPCELDAEETELLRTLVAALGYLGRSESWVEAELTDELAEWNAMPCQDGEHRGPGWEQVSLMAAIPPADYGTWQKQQAEAALAPYPLPEGKKKPTAKLLKDREKAIEPYPVDLIACLTKDTAWWKGHRWSQPPGSQRVLYWRRSDALQVGVPTRRRPVPARPVTMMLLAITTPSGNPSALPPVTRTLPQAELFHRAIIGRLGNGQRVNCPELTGKDESGQPLHDHHEHAHTIPVDL